MKAYDGDRVYIDLERKITEHEKLNDRDKLDLIFLPLMKSSTDQNEMAISAVELARKIEDDEEKLFCIGAIIGISDKFIDKEYVKKLKEMMKMTRVGMELKKEGIEEGIKEGRKEGIKEGKLEAAAKMMQKGFQLEDIIEITGLPEEEIRNLYRLNKEENEKH